MFCQMEYAQISTANSVVITDNPSNFYKAERILVKTEVANTTGDYHTQQRVTGNSEIVQLKKTVVKLENDIKFIQEEHKTLLTALQNQIEQLRQDNQDLQFQLIMKNSRPPPTSLINQSLLPSNELEDISSTNPMQPSSAGYPINNYREEIQRLQHQLAMEQQRNQQLQQDIQQQRQQQQQLNNTPTKHNISATGDGDSHRSASSSSYYNLMDRYPPDCLIEIPPNICVNLSPFAIGVFDSASNQYLAHKHQPSLAQCQLVIEQLLKQRLLTTTNDSNPTTVPPKQQHKPPKRSTKPKIQAPTISKQSIFNSEAGSSNSIYSVPSSNSHSAQSSTIRPPVRLRPLTNSGKTSSVGRDHAITASPCGDVIVANGAPEQSQKLTHELTTSCPPLDNQSQLNTMLLPNKPSLSLFPALQDSNRNLMTASNHLKPDFTMLHQQPHYHVRQQLQVNEHRALSSQLQQGYSDTTNGTSGQLHCGPTVALPALPNHYSDHINQAERSRRLQAIQKKRLDQLSFNQSLGPSNNSNNK